MAAPVGLLLLLVVAGAAHSSSDFDVLIFTQQWPITTCDEWQQRNPRHKCTLPKNERWTIHGVWPTKLGTIGPSFCNKTAHFDPEQLTPIRDQLDKNWMNIEQGQGLWKHEWLKHGTCASVLHPLSSESKYFSQGLNWFLNYTMDDILVRSNVVPGGMYSLQQVYSAVTSVLKKRPYVHCWQKDKARFMLSEIRICFDKTLAFVDCDGTRLAEDGDDDDNNDDFDDSAESDERNDSSVEQRDDGFNSNCPKDKMLFYPTVVGRPVRKYVPVYLPDTVSDDLEAAMTRLEEDEKSARVYFPNAVFEEREAKMTKVPEEDDKSEAKMTEVPEESGKPWFSWLTAFKILNFIKRVTL